jgi:hypothetical protein
MRSAAHRLIDAWRRWGERHRLAQAMILNWAFGMGIGVFCAALLLVFDVFSLRSLLWRSDVAVIGTAMLCAAFAFTFGGVVAAAAVMQFDESKDEPRGRRRRARTSSPQQPVAAPIRAEAPLSRDYRVSAPADETAILRAAPAADPVNATPASTQARPIHAVGRVGSPSAAVPAIKPMQGTT